MHDYFYNAKTARLLFKHNPRSGAEYLRMMGYSLIEALQLLGIPYRCAK